MMIQYFPYEKWPKSSSIGFTQYFLHGEISQRQRDSNGTPVRPVPSPHLARVTKQRMSLSNRLRWIRHCDLPSGNLT